MARFGRTELPPEQADALRRTKRIEWLSIGYTSLTVTLVALVLGNSQAMRTAWLEDMLSTLPQIAFLVALVFIRRRPTAKHPYGMHRSMGVGHLVAGVALVVVGGILAYEAVSGLVKGEHPPIGTVVLLGHTLWLGWLMVAVMSVIAIAPFFFARAKLKLAKELNNKLLHADADMSKADWTTNAASIVGVLGIGAGLWWLDSASAAFISAGILWDGLKNTRAAVLDLLDTRPTTPDQKQREPDIAKVEHELAALPWVRESACRARDLGQVLHIEAFVVPTSDDVSLQELEEAALVTEMDWTMQDVVVVPVSSLPEELAHQDDPA